MLQPSWFLRVQHQFFFRWLQTCDDDDDDDDAHNSVTLLNMLHCYPYFSFSFYNNALTISNLSIKTLISKLKNNYLLVK